MVRLRSVSLLLAGTYAVHTLRYALAFGRDAPREVLRQGHGYLVVAPYVVTVVLAAAVSQLLLQAARGAGAADAGCARSLVRAWGVFAVALLGMFVLQESLEGALAAGHPGGVAGVLGDGGWLAVPLSAAVGLVLALLQRGARKLLVGAARRLRAPRLRPPRVLVWFPLSGLRSQRVAGSWVRGRAPPVLAG
jgi:hypothetical protein